MLESLDQLGALMGVLTIREAEAALAHGRWVAVPTMGRYVLVGCARERGSLASLRALDEGVEPFGVLLRRPTELNGLLEAPPSRRVKRLVGEFWPGGLALRLAADARAVAPELLNDDGHLWAYQDGHPILLQVLNAVGRPLARLALPGELLQGAAVDARLLAQGRYAGHVGVEASPGDAAATLASVVGESLEVLREGEVCAEALWACWEAPLR